MDAKVILEITRGELAGKKYEYVGKERIFIGRQEDCGIVIPEKTVSRYHCVLEIIPPEVKLQDFGSLNGTYLNGKKIGQRDRQQLADEARKETNDFYLIHSGDVLGLGSKCELKCVVEMNETCASCAAVLPKSMPGDETLPEGEEQTSIYYNEKGLRICESCKREEEKQRKAKIVEEQKQKLDEILRAVMGLSDDEKAIGPSPVEGYQKVKLLGKGGMGEVWKVRDEDTDRYYALKTMLPEVQASQNAVSIFLREASIGTYLRHRNVVPTYRSGYSNGVFYILMDLCEGGSVDALIERKGGMLSLGLATWIILQVLDGFNYVHHINMEVEIKKRFFSGKMDANGIVHRDFKPGNIFLSDTSDRPIAMIADFGMAKAFDAAGMSRITKTGSIMGTPVFMPRQQAINFKYAKPEVDIWAVAASYYNMLTGEFPKNFRPGKNVWETIVTEAAIPIRKRNALIPLELATVIDEALQEKPEIGCKSASELRKKIVSSLPENLKNAISEVL